MNHRNITFQEFFHMAQNIFLPLFFFFTVILVGGYFWGVKQNKKITQKIFFSLEEIFKPVEKKITAIGGSIGYHATFILNHPRINKIDLTLVLLPRHSLLWLPFSLLIFRHDRLRITAFLTQPLLDTKRKSLPIDPYSHIFKEIHMEVKEISCLLNASSPELNSAIKALFKLDPPETD